MNPDQPSTPKADFDPFAEFDRLLAGFSHHRKVTHTAAWTISENDEFVRLAFVGFALHQLSERWSREHAEFIKAQRADDWSNESLDWYEQAAQDVGAFAGLAFGALLGLHSRGAISDTEFLHATALLPGFISLNNVQIEAASKGV